MAEAPPTFSESWYRIAGQSISLRPGVRVRRQYYRGERWVVLEDRFSNQYFRLTPSTYEFVARLRPGRTVEQAWQECLDLMPDEAPGQEAVIQLLAQLYLSNLLQYDLASDTAQLFSRYQKVKQRQTRARWLNLMYLRIPLWDPDAFLVRTLPVVGKLLGGFGALLWLLAVGGALKLAADHWTDLRSQTQGILSPANLPLLYLGMVVVKTIHEFGHAYFCRKFGGEVHVMGVLFMIFTPTPYVDATSSWGLRSRWRRMLVGAAGMIVELFVAALAMFVWANTGQGVIHSLAYNMIFVASVSTVVFNINPLLRFDGYYMLSDLLEIPNLHERSLKQLRHLAESWLFKVKTSTSPATDSREAVWLTTFGITSGIYRVIVFGAVILFVADQFLLLGVLMAAFCLFSWIIRPLFLFVRYLFTDPRLERTRPRAIAFAAGGSALLLVVLNVIPFPHYFRAPGILEARRWSEARTLASGQVEQILEVSGARVQTGQPLIRLRNDELNSAIQASRSSVAEIEARLAQAAFLQTADVKPLRSRLQSVQQRLERLERDQKALLLTAPHPGVWVAPNLKEWKGRWLARGTICGLLVDDEGFDFVATVGQNDADRLFSKKTPQAEVRLGGQAEFNLPSGMLRIVPAERQRLPSQALGWAAGGEVPVAPDDPSGLKAVEPFFEVRAPVDAVAGAVLLHGRSGKIRFELDPQPLLPRAMRWLRQLLQRRYQI